MKKNFPITGKELSYPDDANILSTTNLKGAITYINDDFIEISGFTEEELLNKNHNMVRHPEMPPAAFEDLWRTIKSGHSWMGLVKNRCKNGDHYWVDAYVTPIIRNGEVQEFQSVRVKPDREHIDRAEKLYKKLMDGKSPFSSRLPSLNLNAKLGLGLILALFVALAIPLIAGQMSMTMAITSFVTGLVLSSVMIFITTRPLVFAISKARSLYNNKIAQWIYTGRNDDAGQLLLAMKMLDTGTGGIVGRINNSSEQLKAQAENLMASIELNNQGIKQQYSETDQVAMAVNQMAASIQEVAENTRQTAEAAHEASEETVRGKHVANETTNAIQTLAGEVQKAADVINQLEQDSNSISSVVDVIRGIAEQTNLLALNAAIEAARAGEQGRGFAVVADEVRTLASRTQESTAEIQSMIEKLQDAARLAVQVMDDSRDQVDRSVQQATNAATSLDAITNAVQTINDMSTQIATAVNQQSGVSEEINRSITTIRDVAQLTVDGTVQSEESCNAMNNLAASLQELAAQFWMKHKK